MIQVSNVEANVRQVFEPTQRGVVGLVDDLLKLCGEQRIPFVFQNNSCFIRDGNCGDYRIDLPVSKSVLRAILARIAVLCNEQHANSVTPYQGDGSLTIATTPPTEIHVVFTNTPNQQRLEMTPVAILG